MFTKITNAELNSRGATTLANQPTISPQALKEEFDAPAKNIIAPHFNALIDELGDSAAASSIGAVKGGQSTTVQSVLESIGSDIAEIEQKIPEDAEDIQDAVNKRHTHNNKSVIDKFSEVDGDPYYDGNPIAGSVTVDSALSTTSKNPVQNKVITGALNNIGGTPEQIATAVQDAHTHSNKLLLDSYTQTETNLADAVSKKHSHSNKTALDKISENQSGHITYDGAGLQPLIGQEVITPTHSGNEGDLVFEGSSGTTDKKLWRRENGAWVRTMLGHKIIISTTDPGEGATMADDEIYIVVE